MSRWEGFEEFVQVVDSGTFSGAARALGVSKAHVSQQVSRLESRLGSRLLHRTTRKTTLTDTGEIYYKQCRQIIEDLEAAERSVNSLQQKVTGRLRICSPHWLGETFLIPAIAEFLEVHPELDIELEVSSRKVDLIGDHYDLAIQVGRRSDVNVVNFPLSQTTFYVVTSPKYSKKITPLSTPEEIKQYRSLLFIDSGFSKPWKFIHPTSGKTVDVKVNSHWKSNSGYALRAAARQGLGLAYLPDYYLAEDIANGNLEIVLSDWTTLTRDIVAIFQHKQHLSAKIRYFTRFLQEYFKREEHRLRVTPHKEDKNV